ncbi:sugar transferase [Sinirhodobacter huangdaonensis]|uniref:Sugar transferase n=1 Tax=Paenirhodobacter huangdaonensis TaxID=2501515 RepID=A0A443LF79_9RHOB|nr:sugar transferase [Sinirhodobacter huangdaonensis]RWR47725.1 sugar transferase [Sinirhodobacter huangdaonensis]
MAIHDTFATEEAAEILHTEIASAPEKDNRQHALYATSGKRILDLLISMLLLPALLPLMLAIWLIIRSDGSAAIFTQPRVGRDGRIYACHKFRSMVPNAERVLEEMCACDPKVAEEWSKFQKLSNDPRITTIGRILRKTSLDELPQILNVLKGDMSLVGPRPFLPAQRDIYDRAGGRAYYSLRPGVTGLWQVFSRHDTTFASRVRFDEAYGANLSMLADLSLILRTAKVIFLRTGA